MNLLLRQQALLALLAGFVFFTNLGSYALFNDDEPKNAACGAELYRRGDVFVPTFNEDLRTDQPILTYWFMLVSYGIFGISEFSARLGSAVMAFGTTLTTYHLGRKLYSAEVGFLAAIILCTSLLFSIDGRSATTDSTMTFFVTFALASYVWVVAKQNGGNFNRGVFANSKLSNAESYIAKTPDEMPNNPTPTRSPSLMGKVPETWQWTIPMYVAMGLAVLTNGPSGFVVPCVIIILYLLISLRWDDLASETLKSPEGRWWIRVIRLLGQLFRPQKIIDVTRGMSLLIGTGIVAAVALPWYLIVGFMTNGTWLHRFFVDVNFSQVFIGKENHTGFPLYQLYYLVVIPICSFPWSVFLPVAAYQLRQRFNEGAAWRESDWFVACWAGTWIIVFSLISVRMPSYVLSAYPALALILARYFRDWGREEADSGIYSFGLCLRVLGFVGGIMVLGLYVAAYVYFSSAQWIGAIGLIPIAGAITATKFLDLEQRKRVIQTLIATAALLAFVLVGIAPTGLVPYQDSKVFVTEARTIAGTIDVAVATYIDFDPNIVFYTGKKVPKLDTPRQAADYISGHPHAFVIARVSQLTDLRNELLDDVRELSRHRRFLHGEELVLLGRN